MTTRRELLNSGLLSVGAAGIGSMLPRIATAQNTPTSLTERVREDLITHESFGAKFSGGPGDHATADWIAQRLNASGYEVAVSTFDAPFFIERRAGLSTGDVSADVIPQAPVVPTGAAGITARLAHVDAGSGEPDSVGDVRGRIAVVVAPFGRHAALFTSRGFGQTVYAAVEAGAAAIVIVTLGPSGEAVALNAPEEPFVGVPTAVLAPKYAGPFIAAARAGAEGTLILDGDATHRPCKNVVAQLERGRRWLAISTPRSGWFQCVGERGTGTAAFLEIADWARDRYPNYSVFLMNTGGHEYFFAGSHRVLHEAPPAENTQVWMHIGATLAARDAVKRNDNWNMLDTPDPQRRVMATESASAAAEQAFRDLSGMSPPNPVQPQAGELSTFTGMGFTTAFAAIGVHRWFHTPQDTLERVDAGLVVPVIEAHKRTVELIVG